MRILVTNDDGINAPGLAVLERIARSLSKDVWVVAPESEQSGAAHSLTLSLPVRVRKISAQRYAVSGTPTDCVLLALKEIIPSASCLVPRALYGNKSLHKAQSTNHKTRINLVLSGVNSGSNVGDDVTYSGTVAAAMEGTLLGVPSMALSQAGINEKLHWLTAERHAPALIKKLMALQWPGNTLININFPDCPPAGVKGIRVCPQGKRVVNVALSERLDPKGRPLFLDRRRARKPREQTRCGCRLAGRGLRHRDAALPRPHRLQDHGEATEKFGIMLALFYFLY